MLQYEEIGEQNAGPTPHQPYCECPIAALSDVIEEVCNDNPTSRVNILTAVIHDVEVGRGVHFESTDLRFHVSTAAGKCSGQGHSR